MLILFIDVFISHNSEFQIALILTGAGLIGDTQDVRHTSLVGREAGEVHRLLDVITGECLHLGAVLGNTPLGREGHGSMAGRTKLTMRLKKVIYSNQLL